VIRNACVVLMLAGFATLSPAMADDALPGETQPLGTGMAVAPNPADPAQAAAFAPKEGPYRCPRLAGGKNDGKMFLGTVYQGENGWFFRAGDLSEDIDLPPYLLKDFGRLSKAVKAKGSTLVFAPTPMRGQIGRSLLGATDLETVYNPAYADTADAAFRAALVKQGEVVLPAPAPDTNAGFFFKRDHHWTPDGARQFATDLAALITTLPGAAGLPKLAFKTSRGETIALDSPMGSQIGGLCDEPIPAEPVTLYRTEQSAESAADLFGDSPAPAESAGADALFGGGDAPAIALLGTSFSAQERFNFEGFLMEQTRLQVANHSISGGAAYAALLGYFSTAAWHETPSPILIWEFQRNTSTLKEAPLALRQIIPAAKGPCTGQAIAAETRGDLAPAQKLKLDAPAGDALTGPEAYAVIHLSDASIRNVTVRFSHADGQIEDVPLTRHPRLPALDTFYVELSADILSPLSAIEIAPDSATPVSAEVTLCRAASPTP
jgi:alginate biosynthesis protein AlgX